MPQNYGQNLTVLAALDRNGIWAALLVPGATNGDVFWVFIEQVLVPKLRRGDVMVLGNLSTHKVILRRRVTLPRLQIRSEILILGISILICKCAKRHHFTSKSNVLFRGG